MARTPVRQMRLSDELWGRVNAAAKELGTDATGFTRIALEAALSDPPVTGVASDGITAGDTAPNGRAGRLPSESAASKAKRTTSAQVGRPADPPAAPAPSTPPETSSLRVGTPGHHASSAEARGPIRSLPKTPGARKPPPRLGEK